MTSKFTVRGLPTSLAHDGWWLADDNLQNRPDDVPAPRSIFDLSQSWGRFPPVFIALMCLTSLADWLFWDHALGISITIFVWAVFLTSAWIGKPKKSLTRPALLLLCASLPVVEHFQALSLGFQFLGLVIAVAWLNLPANASCTALTTAGLQLLRKLPFFGLKSLFRKLRSLKQSDNAVPASSRLRIHLANWAFPIGGTLVLFALLLEANPLLEQKVIALHDFDFNPADLLERVLFWSGSALIIWPFLKPPHQHPQHKPTDKSFKQMRLHSFGLNAGSVLRALVFFNLVLAMQSTMDLSILFGGAELPQGMTLATYAHRGAYPLLVTAMLAGVFALAARPYLTSHPSAKPMMMLWLAQNSLLGLTSLMRLDLYVSSFGLTYMRSYAMIWMGLVIVGLLLTAWQIQKERSNAWLLHRCAMLGLGTLYLCSFVNFASLIAQQNLSMTSKQDPDWYYLCTLGPLAAPGIKAAQETRPGQPFPKDYAHCWDPKANQTDWREWGFRSWRVLSYVEATPESYATEDNKR